MKRILLVLSILIVSVLTIGTGAQGLPPINLNNSVAMRATFDIWKRDGITQITYNSGDSSDPEYFIMVCNSELKTMDLQYYIVHDGNQVMNADFFTIQNYPKDETKMRYPYYPPGRVVYDSGMGIDKESAGSALEALTFGQKGNFVFSFETVSEKLGPVTKGWTSLIPAEVFNRDLYGAILSDCDHVETRTMTPLI